MSMLDRVDWAMDMTMWLLCGACIVMGVYHSLGALRDWLHRPQRDLYPRHFGHPRSRPDE